MPKLATLLHKSSGDLKALARERSLKGRSNLNKDGLIIQLADEQISEEAEAIIRSSKEDLEKRARKVNLRGYSNLNKIPLILALLRQLGGSHQDTAGSTVVKVYVGGDVVGYCAPRLRAAVSTYLRGAESVEEALERARRASGTTQVQALEQVTEDVPPGATAIEPPR